MLITAWPSLPTALTHTHTQTQRMTGCVPPPPVWRSSMLELPVCASSVCSREREEKSEKEPQINILNGVRWFVCVYSC